ncbi:MAG: LacI family DNA-binding transcriptional regulator [Fibrobacteres bacterium]|nr:LacI family DNA-binding transcriptional regulator [Fibrobacterota bacterium]
MKPSLSDIAEKAQVSKATVSRALSNSNLVSQETRNSILNIAESMGYVPDAALSVSASNLIRSKREPVERARKNVVNVVYYQRTRSDVRAVEYYNHIMEQIERVLTEEGVSIIESYPQTPEEYFRILDATNADGTLILSSIQSIGPEFLPRLRLAAMKNPLILISNYIQGHDHEFNSVRADNVSMGQFATEYLIGKGAKRVLFFDPSHNMAILEDRYMGYRRAMEEAGLVPERIAYDNTSAQAGVSNGLPEGFTLPEGVLGLLLGGDSLAKPLSKAIAGELSRRRDIYMTGIDGIPPLSDEDGRIATIGMDFKAMARATWRLLSDCIDGSVSTPQKTLVGYSLIEKRDELCQ